MCELLGFSAERPADIREQLRGFFSHSDKNPHGWGMKYGETIIKGACRASDSESLERVVSELPEQTSLLAHIRYDTVGSVRLENCHPFSGTDITGREWTLIHNGTIYSGSRLIHLLDRQRGDTDSERLFLYLIEYMNRAQRQGPLGAGERFELIDELIRDIAPRNKLNLMISDGELLYIHKNMKDTMKYRRLAGGMIFATSPVDDDEWQDVPTAKVIACRNGSIVFEGKPHEGIFVPNLQYIKAMDAMNI